MSSIDSTLAERGARYGDFPEHAFITQELKRTLHDNVNWFELADDQKEALDMVMHKIGRILNGDPNYIDSWTDIIGYTRLVEKRLIDEQEAIKNWTFCTNKPVGDIPAPTATDKTFSIEEKQADEYAGGCRCSQCVAAGIQYRKEARAKRYEQRT